jgi:hypothetical protein
MGSPGAARQASSAATSRLSLPPSMRGAASVMATGSAAASSQAANQRPARRPASTPSAASAQAAAAPGRMYAA